MKLSPKISAFFMALFLVSLVGCASTQQHQSASEYIDDAVITTKVKAALFNDPDLSAAETTSKTYNGEVQLSGFVSTQSQINQAVQVAKKVEGVRKVKTASCKIDNIRPASWPEKFRFTLFFQTQ